MRLSRSRSQLFSANMGQDGKPTPNLSFSGCGFLGIYHVGVASCIKQYAPQLMNKVAGCSAGALCACAMICNCSLGECTTFTCDLAIKAMKGRLGPFSPSFELVNYLRKALDMFLPDNAHEIASGRLFISLTKVSTHKNVLVSEFSSKDDLVDALICTSFVPLYSGIRPPYFRGETYVDGGLTDNLPVLNDATITVSPFCGESDICPDDGSNNYHFFHISGTSIQISTMNLYRAAVALFPPSPEFLSNLCNQGFRDTLRYLRKHKLVSCVQHISIQSAILSAAPAEDLIEEAEELEQIEDDDTIPIHECEECEQRELMSLHAEPPVAVLTALEAACNTVNTGMLNQFYKTKAYSAVHLLTSPYMVSYEMIYLLIKRMYEWAPYMSDDMQWFIKGLYALVRNMLIESKSSSVDRPQGPMLPECGFKWKVLGDMKVGAKGGTHKLHTHPMLTGSSMVKVNLDFSAEYTGREGSPLKRVGEARRKLHQHPHIIEDDHVTPVRKLSSGQGSSMPVRKLSRGDGSPQIVRKLSAGGSGPQPVCRISGGGNVKWSGSGAQEPVRPAASGDFVNTDYDSIEHCLDVTSERDALLSYYYLDEKSRTYKVVEIFPVSEGQKTHSSLKATKPLYDI